MSASTTCSTFDVSAPAVSAAFPEASANGRSSLAVSFFALDEASLRRIRKTAESPPRVSIFDTIGVITGLTNNNCANVWNRLQESHPELSTRCRIHCGNFQFPGRGQRSTPVADARTICEIVMLLPGKAAAGFRKQTASVLVRYLGGDPTLAEEIALNRLAQETLPESHPMRIFGETVEAEALERKREDVAAAQLDLRLAELRMLTRKARVEGLTESIEIGMRAMQRLNIPIDDRDRARAKDVIDTAMFEEPRDKPGDKEVCIRSFLQAQGVRDASMDSRVGRTAKQLLLRENPAHTFQKKTIYCNGQLLEANVWTESMRPYLERALAQLTAQTERQAERQTDLTSLLTRGSS